MDSIRTSVPAIALLKRYFLDPLADHRDQMLLGPVQPRAWVGDHIDVDGRRSFVGRKAPEKTCVDIPACYMDRQTGAELNFQRRIAHEVGYQ